MRADKLTSYRRNANAVLAFLVFASCLVSASSESYVRTQAIARTGYPPNQTAYWVDTEWTSGIYEFYTNNSELDDLNDSHFTSSPERFVVFMAHEWAVRAGSGLGIDYKGNATEACNDPTDGKSVFGARSLNAAFNGQAIKVTDYWTGELVTVDICMNSDKDWSVMGSRPATRTDFREITAHELGHALGLEHTPGSIMRGATAPDETYVGLWGDDKQAMRDIYGLRNIQAYGRNYNPGLGTWSGSYTIGSYGTNLPIAGVVGLDAASNWRVFRARTPTNRNSIAVAETGYAMSSGSTWSAPRYLYEGLVDYQMSLMAHTSQDFGSLYFPVQNILRGCNGVKQLRDYDDWATGTIYSSVYSDICTNFGVSVDHDPVSDRLVMAYVASGEGTGGRPQGRIYIRTSDVGSFFTFNVDTQTQYFAPSAPKVKCLTSGSCVLSFADGDSNSQYDKQVVFTINSSGVPSFGTPYSSANWVYDAASPFVSSNSAEKTNIILNFTSSLGDGFHTMYSRHDTSWPVNGGSYKSVGSRTRLPASTVSHPSRNSSGIFYLP